MLQNTLVTGYMYTLLYLHFIYTFSPQNQGKINLLKRKLPVSQSKPVNPERQLQRHVDNPTESSHVPW